MDVVEEEGHGHISLNCYGDSSPTLTTLHPIRSNSMSFLLSGISGRTVLTHFAVDSLLQPLKFSQGGLIGGPL